MAQDCRHSNKSPKLIHVWQETGRWAPHPPASARSHLWLDVPARPRAIARRSQPCEGRIFLPAHFRPEAEASRPTVPCLRHIPYPMTAPDGPGPGASGSDRRGRQSLSGKRKRRQNAEKCRSQTPVRLARRTNGAVGPARWPRFRRRPPVFRNGA